MSYRHMHFMRQTLQQVTAPNVDTSVQAKGLSVDQLSLELSDAMVTVESAEFRLQRLQAIGDNLTALSVGMEASIAEGGLDGTAAFFAHSALRTEARAAGVEPSLIPSLEAYAFSPTHALRASNISMETVKDTVDKVIAMIREAMRKVYEAMKGFYVKAFEMINPMEERAVALKKAASGIQGQAKATSFEDAGLAKNLAVGTSVEQLNGPLSELTALLNDILGNDGFFAKTMDIGRQINDAASKLVGNNETQALALYKFALPKIAALGPESEVDGDGLIAKSKPMLGNKQVVYSHAKPAEEGGLEGLAQHLQSLSSFHFALETAEVSGEVSTSLPTLDSAQIGQLADQVTALCQLVNKFKDIKSAAADMDKLAAGEVAVTEPTDATDAKYQQTLVTSFKSMSAIYRASDRAAGAVLAYAYNTARALLAYGEKSAKQYGVEAATPASTDEPAAAPAA